MSNSIVGYLDNVKKENEELTNISGAKKSAILLMTLGTDIASNIIKNLSDSQIQKIGIEIAKLNTVKPEERNIILNEFVEKNKEKGFIIEGGMDYTRDLLNEALDTKRAEKLIEEINYYAYTKAFRSIRNKDANQILSYIEGDSSQTIAIILSHIQPEKSGQILKQLPENIQKEVVLKIGNISSVAPAIIKAVDKALERKVAMYGSEDGDTNDTIDSLSDILANSDRETEKSIIKFLETKNAILAEQLKLNMFRFEDIADLDSRTVQMILKEIDARELAIAMKDESTKVKDAIFNNQSQRASQALQEEIEMLGPIKMSQIKEVKQSITAKIIQLELEGVIELSRGAEDKFVV